jgi:hypothetical protein
MARPWACVAASRPASSAPPPARARFACGSALTWLSWLRSIIKLPSATAAPDMLWAPPRTVTSRLLVAAKATAAAASAGDAHLAIIAGRRSMPAFHTRRAWP